MDDRSWSNNLQGKLFEKQAVYRRWWIAVTAVAFGAYVGCWVASALNCHPASAYFEFGRCRDLELLSCTEFRCRKVHEGE